MQKRRKLQILTLIVIVLSLPLAGMDDFQGYREYMEDLSDYINIDMFVPSKIYLSLTPYTQSLEKRIVGTSIFDILQSKIVRAWRFVKDSRCWKPNPDDSNGEILKGVDCPGRLKIMDKKDPIRKCIGVLMGKRKAMDGDLTFDVLPNEEYRYLINRSNIKWRKGALHCEIVPDDSNRFEDIFNRMELNSVVEVEGVCVEDTNHNWREFHPVKSLRLVNKNGN